jgi:hypothetical protein
MGFELGVELKLANDFTTLYFTVLNLRTTTSVSKCWGRPQGASRRPNSLEKTLSRTEAH